LLRLLLGIDHCAHGGVHGGKEEITQNKKDDEESQALQR
jgi:hypothetical protein